MGAVAAPVRRIFSRPKPPPPPPPAPAPVVRAPDPVEKAAEDKDDKRRALGQGKSFAGRARRGRSVLGEAVNVEKKTLLGG